MNYIKNILKDSLFYAASGLDGTPIKYFNKRHQEYGINTYVYCDYNIDRKEVIQNLESIEGYELRKITNIPIHEIYDSESLIRLEHEVKGRRYFSIKPYAISVELVRKSEFTDQHGANHINLLYIGGEGVITFKALYNNQNIKPKAVAIIRPGTGFGNNWTNFRDKKAPFAQAVMNNHAGLPEYFMTDFELDWVRKYSREKYFAKLEVFAIH